MEHKTEGNKRILFVLRLNMIFWFQILRKKILRFPVEGNGTFSGRPFGIDVSAQLIRHRYFSAEDRLGVRLVHRRYSKICSLSLSLFFVQWSNYYFVIHHPSIWKFIDALPKVQKGCDAFLEKLVTGYSPHKMLKQLQRC